MSFNIYFLLFPWNFTSHKDGVAAVLSAGTNSTLTASHSLPTDTSTGDPVAPFCVKSAAVVHEAPLSCDVSTLK